MKRIRIHILFFGLFLYILTSCSNHELKPESYVQWIDDKENGLIAEKEIGDLVFEIKYQPLDYIILQQSRVPSIDSIEYNGIKQEVDGLLYFIFSITTTEGQKTPMKYKITSSEDYQYRVSYFSFELSKDFQLVMEKDSLPCVLHHFERTYDLMPKVNFVLGFEKPDNFSEKNLKQDFQFIYDDKIYGVGKIKLVIEKNKINRIPKLKILTYATEN